ncbi:hypothetical protein CC2G_013563 [Coprinopsis cinerea AmutBmut pab1-1]|nr:hypothetical protein CC2G_013563 [Coprinopsis cinerea AmutBmut pab1-1]
MDSGKLPDGGRPSPELCLPLPPSLSSIDLSPTFLTVALESLLVGIFIILTSASLYLWFGRARRNATTTSRSTLRAGCLTFCRWIRNPLVFGSIVLFVIVLAHWAGTTTRLMIAISILNENRSPLMFYTNLAHPTSVLLCLLVAISAPVVDSLLIWRLWVVSGRSKILILPPILAVATFLADGLRVTVWFTNAHGKSIFDPEIKYWILANIVLTALSNLYCSVGLMYHIYRISTEMSKAYTEDSSLPPTRSILNIIIESATIHTAWSILTLVSYITQNNIAIMTLDMGPVVASIAFMLINVRVGLGWDIRRRTECEYDHDSRYTQPPSRFEAARRSRTSSNQELLSESFSKRSTLRSTLRSSDIPMSSLSRWDTNTTKV